MTFLHSLRTDLYVDESSHSRGGGTLGLSHQVAAELAPQWKEWLFTTSRGGRGIGSNDTSFQLVSPDLFLKIQSDLRKSIDVPILYLQVPAMSLIER